MSSGNNLANPKSPIFGLKSLSSNMLLALMSLCTMCGTTSSWRNARPLAVPLQMLDLFPQSSSRFVLLFPTKEYGEKKKVRFSSFDLHMDLN